MTNTEGPGDKDPSKIASSVDRLSDVVHTDLHTLSESVSGPLSVRLNRASAPLTSDLALWVVIRKSTDGLQFAKYKAFMDALLCQGDVEPDQVADPLDQGRKVPYQPYHLFHELRRTRFLPFTDTDGYRLLKVATETFLAVNCGVFLDPKNVTKQFDAPDLTDLNGRLESSVADQTLEGWWSEYFAVVNGSSGDRRLPYLALVRKNLPEGTLKDSLFPIETQPKRTPEQDKKGGKTADELREACVGAVRRKLTQPCLLELIWSYWHEQGMLVQTLNAISRRFQNVRGADPDPLASLEVDPLRPLNNLLWGYIQDEQHRLTVVRRAYEYDHHYGLRLEGKAIPPLRTADSRAKFLEAFHNLLYLAWLFYKQDDDTTVKADGFPVLNALKEVHFLLAEGAHNQFGDLTTTARIEMLMQQWLLARPEFVGFLPTRVMVAYPEEWMGRVDVMKSLQGWTDVSVLHFRDLGVFGEKVLLSIRFGNWGSETDPSRAANWARFWRQEIQLQW